MSRLHLFSFFFVFLASLFFSLPLFLAAHVDGEDDPLYKDCVAQCKKSGCVGDICIEPCKFSSDGKQEVCETECQYNCMQSRQEERKKHGENPVKYHGKWPFRRVFGIQEPVAAALSALNLAIQFHGWISFSILVYYKLPLRPNNQTYYECTRLWHIFGLLSTNYFFWNAMFHFRDAKFTETLDHSAAVALLGFKLLLVIVRTLLLLRDDANITMVEVPLFVFVATHTLYLKSDKPDLGVFSNAFIFMAITTFQLLVVVWLSKAVIWSHPGRWKVGVIVLGLNLALFFKMYEFPPYMGYVDSHALWHATAIPVSYLLWSFVKDDAEFRTQELLQERHLS